MSSMQGGRMDGADREGSSQSDPPASQPQSTNVQNVQQSAPPSHPQRMFPPMPPMPFGAMLAARGRASTIPRQPHYEQAGRMRAFPPLRLRLPPFIIPPPLRRRGNGIPMHLFRGHAPPGRGSLVPNRPLPDMPKRTQPAPSGMPHSEAGSSAPAPGSTHSHQSASGSIPQSSAGTGQAGSASSQPRAPSLQSQGSQPAPASQMLPPLPQATADAPTSNQVQQQPQQQAQAPPPQQQPQQPQLQSQPLQQQKQPSAPQQFQQPSQAPLAQPQPIQLSQQQQQQQPPPPPPPPSQVHQAMAHQGQTPQAASRPATGLASPVPPPISVPVAKVTNFASSQAPSPIVSEPKPQAQPSGPIMVDMPKVKDALGYLEKVKKKFFDRPNVYNQFLEIMKEFKAQTINTEGVIKRVTTLFQGHRELILGFNQFLPPGYKITDPTMPPSEPAPKPTVEFNHAVKYVAKIKQRFESRPEVYEDFLEILHAYQEKRATDHAIEQVKGQVQNLFRGHPDLLDDFNYFLPPEAGGSMPSSAKQPKRKKQRKEESAVSASAATAVPAKRLDQAVPTSAPLRVGLPLTQTTPPTAAPSAVRRVSGNVGALIPPGPYATVSYPPDSKKEMQLFEKIKMAVPRSLYVQLMRVLNLFACNIITRAELISLVDDLFLKNPKYAEFSTKFKEVLGYNEWEENQLMTHMRSNFYAFVSSVDFTTCKQVTPSYRELPSEIPCPPCSGRTILGDSVLNDTCISIPTGTEDQSFKSSRKNQYEEALFKVEDERYEIDMMIENNAAAIRVLQPLNDKISTLTSEQASVFKLDGTVDILHIRAMARIYGDAWYDIIRLLKQIPATAIPIILRRLKQKDTEWRRARENMKRTWKEIVKANFHRSLDHRSFTFKSEEKKRLSSKHIIAELKEAHEKACGEAYDEPISPAVKLARSLYNYSMNFCVDDRFTHNEIFDLVKSSIGHLSNDDRTTFLQFWTGFVHHFLDVNPESQLAIDVKKLSTRPVRMSMEAWGLEEMTSPMRRHTRDSHLFFGSLPFFVFFRLYQLLYSRWKSCHDLAFSKPNGDEVYGRFKELVYSVVDGKTDQVSYEDNLRKLIGAKSYTMFTVEKLVSNIIKLTHSLMSNQLSQKLVNLYAYEHARVIDRDSSLKDQDPLEQSALLSRMYLMNCCAILGDEDHCVQIEYFKDTCEIGIGYLDNLAGSDSRPPDSSWEQYLDRYLHTASSSSRPFLRRTLRKPDSSKTVVTNGLESKICRRTFKTYFIEDTEDVFYRQQHLRRANPSARRQRFLLWWHKQPSYLNKSSDTSNIFRNEDRLSNSSAKNLASANQAVGETQPMDLS